MTFQYINGNSRVVVDHEQGVYALQHPCGGEHNDWATVFVKTTPEDFLKGYLDRNLNRMRYQKEKFVVNLKKVLSALA